MRHRHTILTASLIVSTAVLSSCGGDSGPSSSDKAFCKEIEQLDELEVEADFGKAAGILTELAKKAPNDEVRNALGVIAPIFEKISNTDATDEAAMSAIFELMSSPEVTAASKVLDSYGSDVCGFNDSADSIPSDTTP